MRFIHDVVVTPILLILASGPRAVGATAPADPCAQLTAAQVSSALGETVAAGQKSNTVTCTWIADKPIMVRVYGVDPARQLAIKQPIAQAVAAKL
jgi:hypothetical protein